MRRDTINCSRKSCKNAHKEEYFNQGHPGWGEIIGIVDDHGENPHICPECMLKIKDFLNDDLD